MYFDNVILFPVRKKIKNLDKLYAHFIDNDGKVEKYELLEEHMDSSIKYFSKIITEKNLDNIFVSFEDEFLKGFSVEAINLWKELIYNVIYCHDLGKSNPNFQVLRMNNNNFQLTSSANPRHSMNSACIYFNYYLTKVLSMNREEKKTLLFFLTINSFIISKHHSELYNVEEFFEKLINKYENKDEFINCVDDITKKISQNKLKSIFCKKIEEYEGTSNWSCISIYIYVRFIYGLLVSCDFYATYDFQNKKDVEELGIIKDVDRYYNLFKESKVYKNIEKYKKFLEGVGESPFKENDINKLRSEMFLDSEEHLLKTLDKHIFLLEAPTGSGKTNSSMNLAFKILKNKKDINKLFYIFPFNTLVEQTKDSFFNIFENDNDIKNEVAVINSITPIKIYDEVDYNSKEYKDYEKSLLSRQFLHYPINLSTHVNLFKYLFGIDRESAFPLIHLANSVIILDEIQSYRNEIWKEIILFLKAYSRLLNIKIIIMSATLPDLSKLSYEEEGFARLITNREKYFNNPLFKNRVEVDFSLLDIDSSDIGDILLQKVIDEAVSIDDKLDGKVVVEFIKKSSAENFYNELKEVVEEEGLDKEVLLITGDDNKVERKRIIDKIKESKNVILIATQVIEAGVDIDMDLGFKDISILDSEEQFLGRINRSCRKENCKVFFFNKDEASNIYKNDIRKKQDLVLKNEDIKEMLINKNFDDFYDKVLEILEEVRKEENDGNIDDFRKNSVCTLKFKEIEEKMKLIKDDRRKYTIFLNTDIEENGEIISGSEIWNKYKKLLTDNKLAYAERKVKLSQIAEKVDYFTYEVDKINFSYDDILGDLVYIEDGEKYFENGKFSRMKLQKVDEYEFC